MSPKYEEDLSSALGAICEVLTRENHLLFGYGSDNTVFNNFFLFLHIGNKALQ